VATERITADACYPRHRHQEFLRFLKKVAAAHPDVELHIVADNYSAHKHRVVKAWLRDNPRITLHFTPTSCSWLNIVEIFFGIITRQAIRRSTFHSVKDLTAAIGAFIDGYFDRCTPFAWTKDADELLAKIRPSKSARQGLTPRDTRSSCPAAAPVSARTTPGQELLRLDQGELTSRHRNFDKHRVPPLARHAVARRFKPQNFGMLRLNLEHPHVRLMWKHSAGRAGVVVDERRQRIASLDWHNALIPVTAVDDLERHALAVRNPDLHRREPLVGLQGDL
jgi:transposase